jgi:tetratricopeptide (TPR) repeat protein
MPDAEIARLEELVAGDPAAPAFSALAEAHRRSGDPEQAERVARAGLRARPDHVAGRVALGLALLDRGCADEARAELARALEVIPDHVLAQRVLAELESTAPPSGDPEGPLGQIAEREVEEALAQARADRDAMLDADQVAQRALREYEVGEPAFDAGAEDEGVEVDALVPDSPFATRTVADLLERQGHHVQAAELRRGLDAATSTPRDGRRKRVIRELERWLERAARLRRP